MNKIRAKEKRVARVALYWPMLSRIVVVMAHLYARKTFKIYDTYVNSRAATEAIGSREPRDSSDDGHTRNEPCSISVSHLDHAKSPTFLIHHLFSFPRSFRLRKKIYGCLFVSELENLSNVGLIAYQMNIILSILQIIIITINFISTTTTDTIN